MTGTKGTRAALYARYSSDLQQDRSINDQFGLCREMAERAGLKIIATFEDRAKSGASILQRDGIKDLLAAVEANRFDVVIAESLDRISREPADMHFVHNIFEFHGVRTLTQNDGWVNGMGVAIRSIAAKMERVATGDRVRRTFNGLVKEGKIPGGVTYGYRPVPGKPSVREPDPECAAVVNRIFSDYAIKRMIPSAICLALTREGVPPIGKSNAWSVQRLLGSVSTHGILTNPIYIGILEWNRSRRMKNPRTGNFISKPAPKDDYLRLQVPHLRIIDQTLWDAAQKRLQERSSKLEGTRRGLATRHDYLLGGLLRCGTCHSPMAIRMSDENGPRVACNRATSYRLCDHRKSYGLHALTAGVIRELQAVFTSPESMLEAFRAASEQYARDVKANQSDRTSIEKKLARLQNQIGRIEAFITDSDMPIAELKKKWRALKAEQQGLNERLEELVAETNVITLHPRLLDAYRAEVTKLADDLTAGTPEAHAKLRDFIDHVVVHPVAKRRADYEFTIYSHLDTVLGRGDQRGNGVRRKAEIDQGDTDIVNITRAEAHLKPNKYMLGRWRTAAG